MMFSTCDLSILTAIARVLAACTIVQLPAASPSTVARKAIIRPGPRIPGDGPALTRLALPWIYS